MCQRQIFSVAFFRHISTKYVVDVADCQSLQGNLYYLQERHIIFKISKLTNLHYLKLFFKKITQLPLSNLICFNLSILRHSRGYCFIENLCFNRTIFTKKNILVITLLCSNNERYFLRFVSVQPWQNTELPCVKKRR